MTPDDVDRTAGAFVDAILATPAGKVVSRIQRITYWEWVRSEAALVETDGCSVVTGARVDCCFEHDLAFWFGRDPHDAYRRWCRDEADYWGLATAISFDAANRRFRQCLQNQSGLGRWSPLAAWRWLGVQYSRTSRDAWARHRARETQGVGV